ncbi:MAG: transcription elongation factor GreA [Dehalococcoidia bacterium]|nr:transcription elongation factor GreA [Dehalococcoidia bacterium]
MNSGNQNLSLGEAASSFLASLPAKEGEASQQTVYGFVRWYGWERPFSKLTAPEVANYAEQLSSSDANYIKNLASIRAFLIYAKKQGWSKVNLAAYLKTKKAKAKSPSSIRQQLSPTTSLTQQGYTELKAKLADLKSKRSQVIDEIRRAAADKDFRENAPLEAAREERGHLEGRIKELEAVLKSATIIDETQKSALKVNIGDTIILQDEVSGEELHYMIVSPREVDPTKGKISSNSPIGKTVIGRARGEIIEITAPVGKLRYQIKQIER